MIIISLVAAHAGIRGVVVIPVVAVHTVIGNSYMCPVQYPIIIMDREGRRFPVWLRCVAGFTIRRNA